MISAVGHLTRFARTSLPKLTLTRHLHRDQTLLAGHSKWQNIRHVKALNDGRKAVLFIKLARQIRLAVQAGGPNPAVNNVLRAAIDEALKKNMPNATIQGILKKCTAQSVELKKYTVEIKALDQVNIICVLYTDRFAQLKMEMATILRKNFALFFDTMHAFDERGFIEAIPPPEVTNDQLDSVCTDHAIETGAEDIEVMDESNRLVRFLCEARVVDQVRKELEKLNYSVEHTEQAYFPKSTIKLNADAMLAYEKLKEKLKAMDGVEDIYDNVEITG
ncbi:probable transcriptional regulatory protein Teth514_1449 [Anopheles darlingi]|uniref:probable transcriptional regulatory protein Teth514_1449 n=1 Tax=Anopheles darlingi TaxID=43151 RepID=UPI002100106A|nr:probable transcriptional regulatory protein Teth514_1449 [Anopheles darlingi]XP_049536968.1 probable transcriptional regulatory protein Teth514_1449 [Anopheles darlingi]